MKWFDSEQYAVLDIETSIKNRGENAIGSMQASPYHPDNKIVVSALHINDTKAYTTVCEGDLPNNIFTFITSEGTKILVGHNIKFDVLYCQKYYSNFIKDLYDCDVVLWDTMVVEYLLTGQQSKFSSLDELSAKYGGVLKDDKIKKYWEDNVDTEDIPRKELIEYLLGDINNTLKIFNGQKAKIATYKEPSISILIYDEMQSLKDTILTEWNGMYVDTDALALEAKEVSQRLEGVEGKLAKWAPELNWNSPKQLHPFLFGGRIKVGQKEVQIFDDNGDPVRYKTGKKAGEIKTRLEDDIRIYGGNLTSVEGNFYDIDVSTDEKGLREVRHVIETLEDTHHPLYYKQIELIDTILEYRSLSKDFHTYYMGIGKAVWGTDSCVHAQFNHTGTDTGRLSSSSPNLQNITGGE